jgi:inhibitor of KinA sporulation pathway (predicted exonuclease)
MKTYIIVDLESTCVENKDPNFQNEIIEIGAVKVNHKGEVLGEFQAFVKPVRNPILSDFCKELTTITQAEVDAAKSFRYVLPSFLNWCSEEQDAELPMKDMFNNVWFCSWGYYDKSQFRKDCDFHSFVTDWIDNHISLKHQHGAMIGIPRGLGMKAALNKLKIKFEGVQHRALSDAKGITNIFLSLFDKWTFN